MSRFNPILSRIEMCDRVPEVPDVDSGVRAAARRRTRGGVDHGFHSRTFEVFPTAD